MVSGRLAVVFATGLGLALAHGPGIADAGRAAFGFDSLLKGGLRAGEGVMRLRADLPENSLLAVGYDDLDEEGARMPPAASVETAEAEQPYRFGVDYLYGKSTMSFDYRTRSGTDYEPGALSVGVARTAFGGQTTFRLGVAGGEETLPEASDTFTDSIEQFNYTLGFSQMLSRSLLMDVGYATGFEEAYELPVEPAADPAAYTGERTSSALSLRAFKNWSDSASTLFGYRYFWDSWDIRAHTWEAEHTNQLRNGWLVDLYYRYYTRGKASANGEDFAEELSLSERELGTFASSTVGARLRYELFERAGGFNNGSLNLSYEIVEYDFDDYAQGAGAGDDPYSFSADSLRLFFSLRY